MDINQIILGAFVNAIDSNTLTEAKMKDDMAEEEKEEEEEEKSGMKNSKKKEKEEEDEEESEMKNSKKALSEAGIRTNLDTKRLEKEAEAAPLAISAGLGATTARKRISKLKKASIKGMQI